jgi:hypothetical protein
MNRIIRKMYSCSHSLGQMIKRKWLDHRGAVAAARAAITACPHALEQVRPEVGGRSDREAATTAFDQSSNSLSSGRSGLATTLILIFVLVGIIGGIVLFVMKSSIIN